MRIFVIHLSKATCQEWGLKERNIDALLQDLDQDKHPIEVFNAVYSKTQEGLHPLVSAHLQYFFLHKNTGIAGGGGGGWKPCCRLATMRLNKMAYLWVLASWGVLLAITAYGNAV